LATASLANGAGPDPQGLGPAERLRVARAAAAELEYERAVRLCEPLLGDAAPPRIRAEALALTAIAHLVVGRQEQGVAATETLYELAPGFALDDPSLPPRVTDVFTAAAGRKRARSASITVRAAPEDPAAFTVHASGATAALAVACRPGRRGAFAPLAVTRGRETFRLRLPTPDPYQCHAVALDAHALPLGRLGTAAHPFSLAPPPPPEEPITTRWWFWTGVGTIAAAGVAVAVVVATQSAAARLPDADVTAVAQSRLRWAW
jgi:hypothetical protein